MEERLFAVLVYEKVSKHNNIYVKTLMSSLYYVVSHPSHFGQKYICTEIVKSLKIIYLTLGKNIGNKKRLEQIQSIESAEGASVPSALPMKTKGAM